MHSGLAMDLSGLQQRGLRRTGWPGKTPASPDFPFHPVAWQCGREPESNGTAAYSHARRSGKQGKRTGASGTMSPIYPSSHPPRTLWMVAHRQAPACDHRKLGVLCRHFADAVVYFQESGLCFQVVFPCTQKCPCEWVFSHQWLKGFPVKRKRPPGSVFMSLSD